MEIEYPVSGYCEECGKWCDMINIVPDSWDCHYVCNKCAWGYV